MEFTWYKCNNYLDNPAMHCTASVAITMPYFVTGNEASIGSYLIRTCPKMVTLRLKYGQKTLDSGWHVYVTVYIEPHT